VSNGQTAFFRDPAQLDLVGDVMLELAGRGRPIQVWSAGCATGEEAYSIAMIASARQVAAEILGTDINRDFLGCAATARYGSWSLRRMGQEWRNGYLRTDSNGFVVDDAVKAQVRFEQHNLVHGPCPTPPGRAGWDIILCRNVFIYFSPANVRATLERMASVLGPDGWLFLGASEGLVADIPALAPVARHGRIGYRRSISSVGRAGVLPPQRVTVPTLVEIGPVSDVPPDDIADDLYANATVHIEGKNLDRAVQLLRELVRSDADHLRGRITLGNVLLSQHRFDDASEVYGEAQARAPLMAEVHYFQGVLHRKTRELESAASAFRRALFLDDSFWPAAFQHATVLRRLGRLGRSRAELGHALRSLERVSGRLPFVSHVDGLTGLWDSAERVEAACRRELAAHARARGEREPDR
jgi:chemotaxis protein methyltransferase CheR